MMMAMEICRRYFTFSTHETCSLIQHFTIKLFDDFLAIYVSHNLSSGIDEQCTFESAIHFEYRTSSRKKKRFESTMNK